MMPADRMRALPSLGWVEHSTPLTNHDAFARHLGLAALYVKRDDMLDTCAGGSKVRKLDLLLATPGLREATRWVSAGAIGSGHLVACTLAAAAQGRSLSANAF